MDRDKFTKAELIEIARAHGVDLPEQPGRLSKQDLIDRIEQHQAAPAGTVVLSTDALSQDEARTVAHRMGRPVWEGGESRQAFDERLAEWKSAQAS